MRRALPEAGWPRSLLDRLVDDDVAATGRSSMRPTESPDPPDRAMDLLLRDLRWLFNTTASLPTSARRGGGSGPGPGVVVGAWSAAGPSDAAATADGLASSVIGFGMPPLAGHPTTHEDAEVIARALSTALRRFEPRLAGGSIRVRPERVASGRAAHLLGFAIEASFRPPLSSRPLRLRTEIDLDNGQAHVDHDRPSPDARRSPGR